ncbi:hemerythrin domain-containing protein [Amycolatopsis sp. QT-25]|uniref:hemerythrin domain-containing protein n=1 Tax=Amycolatopsis sp. QT-25 TaxID=3034022 RepID=UPI0023EA8BF2|nr:hemerythrin domain-containing protein [Amycolatopsis sp. QT-25]WET77961.1 hemerythrin domain-containing protein [Amycolatopsis sp. QT-25]
MTADVVDLIMQDHREVERLFDELERHPEKRPLLVPVLSSLLTAHSRAEEAEVYPAAKSEADESDDVAHGQKEHAEAEELLVKLNGTDPRSKQFDKVLSDLVEAVTHHVKEEESTILPKMRRELDETRRHELGEAFVTSRTAHLGDRPGEATKEERLTQARNAGVTGASKMGKDEIARQIVQSS